MRRICRRVPLHSVLQINTIRKNDESLGKITSDNQ